MDPYLLSSFDSCDKLRLQLKFEIPCFQLLIVSNLNDSTKATNLQ